MRILIFGTMWVNTPHREQLLRRWMILHCSLNPGCDRLLVDGGGPTWPGMTIYWPADVGYLSFPDDIGCAVRGGRDGWGRAFTTGLQHAIDEGYDYVVHIEGDSLFRLPVAPICEQMAREGVVAMSTPINGMKNGPEPLWVESGLMFFSVPYLIESDLITKYDWPTLKKWPVTTESVLFKLLGNRLKMMPWHAFRDDRRVLTPDNVVLHNIDWITHCWDDIKVYDRWMAAIEQMEGAAA